MLITSKGQVTIPKSLRDAYGFLPNTEVTFKPFGNTVQIVKKTRVKTRGKKILKYLKKNPTITLSTDEIMQLTRGD